jgi:hypothetical protein
VTGTAITGTVHTPRSGSPSKRPQDRNFAEYRAIDPDGNNFDISTNGYQDIRPDQMLSKSALAKLAELDELEKAEV